MIARRDFLAGATLFALATGLPREGIALPLADTPSPHLARLLKIMSQLVLPRTDMAGAGDVGVGAFVSLALAHGLEGTRQPIRSAPRSPAGRCAPMDRCITTAGWIRNCATMPARISCCCPRRSKPA